MTIEDLDLYDHYPRLKAAKAMETPTPGEARSVEALRAVVTTLARLPSYKEAAQLSLAESPRHTTQLWRQLVNDQRTWLAKSLIEVIDGEYPRDLWKWFNVLDFMRVTHAPRT